MWGVISLLGKIHIMMEKSVEVDDSGIEGFEKDNELECGNDGTALGENVEVLEDGDDDTTLEENVCDTLWENDLVVLGNDFDTLGENNSSTPKGRIKRTPRWMDDYVHGANFLDESMYYIVHDDWLILKNIFLLRFYIIIFALEVSITT